MAKYEKFEEWMVGERVHWEGSSHYAPDSGVVRGMYYGDCNTLNVYWDATKLVQWINVGDVTFEKDNKVEEQNTEKEIKWEIGQVVWDTCYEPTGKVYDVHENSIDVQYPFGVVSYWLDGRPQNRASAKRTLFFSEPVVVAETMPPKKPFAPRLKEGDVVVIDTGDRQFITTIEREEEDEIFIKRQVSGVQYPKRCIKIYKLGEEVK